MSARSAQILPGLLLLLAAALLIAGLFAQPIRRAYERQQLRQKVQEAEHQIANARAEAGQKAAAEAAAARAAKFARERAILKAVGPFVEFMEKSGDLYYAFDQTRFTGPLERANAALVTLDAPGFRGSPLASDLVPAFREAATYYKHAKTKHDQASKFYDDTFVLRVDPYMNVDRKRIHQEILREGGTLKTRAQGAAERFVKLYKDAVREYGPLE